MRYRRHEDGSLEPLPQSGIDTGMGLERLLTILQDKPSVFATDVFQPWMETIPPLWSMDESSLRVIVDHLRSSIVVIGDGVTPSTTGRGYVLRRLTRRVLTTLWRDDSSRLLSDLPRELIGHTLEHFRQPCEVGHVREVLLDEERRFSTLLRRGRQVLTREGFVGKLSEEDYDYLHQTHGLPRDLVVGLLTKDGSGPSTRTPGSRA
jgi:alanyl-tRNA synthetase